MISTSRQKRVRCELARVFIPESPTRTALHSGRPSSLARKQHLSSEFWFSAIRPLNKYVGREKKNRKHTKKCNKNA